MSKLFWLMPQLEVLAILLTGNAAKLSGQNSPTLNVEPASFAFTYQLGTAPPPVRLWSVTSSGAPLTFHVSLSTSSGGNWLTVTPSVDGITPANLGVILNPSAIEMDAPGMYNGNITLTSNGASNSGLSIPVELIVSGSQALIIGGLSPNSATAGGPAFTLTVNGSGYLPGSMVQWNGVSLATAYMSGTQLTAAVSANLITNAGSASVTVVNPGGAVSTAVTFTINAPTPIIGGLSPNSATVGGPAFTLTVNGSGYLPGSMVQWNGSLLPTRYVSGAQLTASVSATLIASVGSPSVIVINAGGAASNTVMFTINPQGTLSIITGSLLPPGTVGTPYSQALVASGGIIPYKSWVMTAGTVPPGILVTTPPSSQTGLVSGVPTVPGTYSFTMQVTDNANATASMQFGLTINPSGVAISNIANAASYVGGSVAPGEVVVITGSGFGPSTPVTLQLDNRGYVSTTLAGVQALFDGVPAPLIYVEAGIISAVVPYSVNGESSTQVQISSNGQNSSQVVVPVAAVAPGIFTLDQSGRGQGAIVNQDGTVNSPDNPASAGSYVAVYATGEGQTNPGGVDGKLGDTVAPRPIQSPTATIGGISAQVQYAGGAPGLVAGVSQINVQIPLAIAGGGSVPLVLNFGDQPTQPGVTVAIK